MSKTKYITMAAVIAAIYTVLTTVPQGISMGIIQVRVSEAVTILAGLTSSAIPGLFIGCLASNLLAGGHPIDIIFGSLTTLLAAFLSYKLKDKPFLVPLPPVLLNAVVVGTYLYYLYGINEGISIWYSIASVGIGEFIACYVIGLPLFYVLKNYKRFFS